MSGTRLMLEGLIEALAEPTDEQNEEQVRAEVAQLLRSSSSFSDDDLVSEKYKKPEQNKDKILNGDYHPQAFKPALRDDLAAQLTAVNAGALGARLNNSSSHIDPANNTVTSSSPKFK